MGRCGASGLVVLLGSAGWLSAEPVEFRLLNGQAVVVPVRVNDEGPFDFVLDTGSSTTVIHRGLAERLSLHPEDRVRLVMTGGSRVVPRSRLRRVELGEARVEGLSVLVSDLAGARSAGTSIQGILGQNFLSRFNYTLDYERRRLTVDDRLVSPGEGIRLAVERSHGRALIAAQPESENEPPLRLVLDSGAGVLILFDRPSPGPKLNIERSHDPLTMTTGKGRRLERRGWLRRLRLGEETLRDVPVALVTRTAGAESRVEHGLLPTLLFRSVYFNNRDDFVILIR